MSYLKEILFNKKRLKIQIDSDADQSVFNEIFVERGYKAIEVGIIKATGCIIDVGAHKGMFAIYAEALNENVPIFSYEPEEANFSQLKENLKLNNCKNVTAKNLAVASVNGTKALFIQEDSHNHSIVKSSKNSKTVNTISLENIILKLARSYGNIDVLKLDCEGAEFEIIDKTPVQSLQKISMIYIEFHLFEDDFDPKKIISKLEAAGFKTKTTPSFYDKKMGEIIAIKQ